MPWDNESDSGFRGGFGQVSSTSNAPRQQQRLAYNRPSLCTAGFGGNRNMEEENSIHNVFQQKHRASPDSGVCTPESESQCSIYSEGEQQLLLSPLGGATVWPGSNPGKIIFNDRSQSVDAQIPPISSDFEKRKISAPAGTVAANQALECSCNRPKALVACQRCGFETNGRVQKTCKKHPNRKALMDLMMCPKCRSKSCLKELREHD